MPTESHSAARGKASVRGKPWDVRLIHHLQRAPRGKLAMGDAARALTITTSELHQKVKGDKRFVVEPALRSAGHSIRLAQVTEGRR